MNFLLEENQLLTDISDLTYYFNSGIKNSQSIGVEFEKLPINNKTFKATEFFFHNGMFDFLTNLKETQKLIPHYEENILLGLFSNNGSISLEPGSQLEYSLKPEKNISAIEKNLDIYNQTTNKLAEQMGISFLALGLHPLSTFDKIKIIPKQRYKFMTQYLKDQASHPFVMMRESAGIQASIDYSSEEDAISKLSTALKLSPFLSAFFCNSPIREGKLSGYKSFRSHAWLNTDNKRCGLISKELFQKDTDFNFESYSKILCDIPMIFHKDNYVGNMTFKELLTQKQATKSDWETHLSLFFPDVRLKSYIEIRNHDCQRKEYALAIPALYKGIFYSTNGIQNINELLKEFSYYDYEFAKYNAPKFGMDFEIKDKKISNIIREIFLIAQDGLKEFNQNEEKYLEASLELLAEEKTPADIIIQNFNGSWNKNLSKLIEYSKII